MPKYDLQFDLIESSRQLRQLEAFLLANTGAYNPERHAAWVEDVCIPAIARDERRALAWWAHGNLIGDAVLKPLGLNAVELKNFRMAPDGAGKHLGSVMMSHVMLEGRDMLLERGLISSETDTFTIQLDTGEGLVSYFAHHGFDAVKRAELYMPGRQEVIMQRTVPLH